MQKYKIYKNLTLQFRNDFKQTKFMKKLNVEQEVLGDDVNEKQGVSPAPTKSSMAEFILQNISNIK